MGPSPIKKDFPLDSLIPYAEIWFNPTTAETSHALIEKDGWKKGYVLQPIDGLLVQSEKAIVVSWDDFAEVPEDVTITSDVELYAKIPADKDSVWALYPTKIKGVIDLYNKIKRPHLIKVA